MPPPINEVDVDCDAQIQEIRRLISSTRDPDRRLVLEDQLRELELLRLQDEPPNESVLPLSARIERRKSFRPTSARPRPTLMASLSEDQEVLLTTAPFQELGSLQRSVTMASLVLDVMATSIDEHFAPTSVLSADHGSFWMTSGLFPQTLRLTLRSPVAVRDVEVTCRYVRRLQIRTASSRTNTKHMAIVETELPATESSQLTTHCVTIDRRDPVEVIEVGVESAWNDFALVYVVRFRQAEPNGDADADTDAGENG